MKTLISTLMLVTLAHVSAEHSIHFFGEFAKPLKNCKFYLYEADENGNFVKAVFRGKKLESGSVTLESLPDYYWFGVESEDGFRCWWNDDNSPGNHLKITKPKVAIYVPPVGHVEIKVSNPDIVGKGFKNRIRCHISGEGGAKSFPITFKDNGSFVITDRRPGNHQITITSNDGKTVFYKSKVFQIEKMKKISLPLITLVKP